MPFDPFAQQMNNARMKLKMGAKYDPAEYQYEKIVGKRTKTGELKLKRLKAVHRAIIGYHIRGLSNRDIAFVTGMDEITIGRVLRDPLSQQYVKELIDASESEINALLPMATDAIRRGLMSDNEKTALNAADKIYKATGRYSHEGPGKQETAEDVIARVLGIAQTQADTLREVTRTERPRALEIEFEEVPQQKVLENGNGSDDREDN